MRFSVAFGVPEKSVFTRLFCVLATAMLANFQDRLVMTASITLRVCYLIVFFLAFRILDRDHFGQVFYRLENGVFWTSFGVLHLASSCGRLKFQDACPSDKYSRRASLVFGLMRANNQAYDLNYITKAFNCQYKNQKNLLLTKHLPKRFAYISSRKTFFPARQACQRLYGLPSIDIFTNNGYINMYKTPNFLFTEYS